MRSPICAGPPAAYDLTVGSIAGFTNPVTLSASGHPAGTSTSFSANPVAPPGSSTLTIGNTASAVAGSYLITVSGAASGSPGHSIDLTLDVYDDLPGIVTLVAPANGALNVPLQPTYSWNAALQAASYLLEVDDDPGFGSPIIVQAGIPGTSVTPTTSLRVQHHLLLAGDRGQPVRHRHPVDGLLLLDRGPARRLRHGHPAGDRLHR